MNSMLESVKRVGVVGVILNNVKSQNTVSITTNTATDQGVVKKISVKYVKNRVIEQLVATNHNEVKGLIHKEKEIDDLGDGFVILKL